MAGGRTTARALRVLVLLAAALMLTGVLAGCGGTDEAELRAEQIRERGEKLREEGEKLRERGEKLRERGERLSERTRVLARRVRARLKELEQVVPAARQDTAPPRSRARDGEQTIDAFLTEVLQSVDRYWTRTFAAAGRPEPRVSYSWVPPGRQAATACQVVADDSAAFYCTGDDTIYVAERFASDLLRGVQRGLPGESAGYGRAAGDFGVAYVVAHEYAHNLQDELGLNTARPRLGTAPFELQADCLAGSWGNSVYEEGKLQPGDVEEAINTALAVGDFDYEGPNHHGTPDQRREAWELGFRSGEPSRCSRYVPAT